MRKVLPLAFLLLFLAKTVYADPFDAFNYILNYSADRPAAQKLLDYFAEDLGQAIAGGAYGVGGNFGMAGVKLSLKVSYQQVSKSDLIIRTSGDTVLTYPIVQGEFVISEKLDGILRLSHMHSSTIFGGGLSCDIYESYEDYIPSVLIQSVYNFVMADDGFNKFNGWNLKTSPVAFFGRVPYVQPYAFLSYDITGVTAKSSVLEGLSSMVEGFGYGAGGSLMVGTVNINFSISMYKGEPNYNFGVFIGV
jgi:hypothetical protein